jgi:hypothetical protein
LNSIPCIKYLQVDSIYDIDFELFVQDILNKITKKSNYQLRSLCFSVPTADDDMVKN